MALSVSKAFFYMCTYLVFVSVACDDFHLRLNRRFIHNIQPTKSTTFAFSSQKQWGNVLLKVRGGAVNKDLKSGSNEQSFPADGSNNGKKSTGLWGKYMDCLTKYPLVTKTVTNGVITGFGDLLAQAYSGSGVISIGRMLKYTFLSVIFLTPILHYWFGYIDSIRYWPIFKNRSHLFHTIIAVGVDQLIGAVWVLTALLWYFTVANGIIDQGIGNLGALNAAGVEKVKHSLVPTLYANWKIWPIASFLNFFFVPEPLRVPFSNLVALFWNAILSVVVHAK